MKSLINKLKDIKEYRGLTFRQLKKVKLNILKPVAKLAELVHAGKANWQITAEVQNAVNDLGLFAKNGTAFALFMQ